MALTLAQIPGFADINDGNFAAEQYAIGLNFQRLVDNAKFGIVRPEVFVGRYTNGQTIPQPTSLVDGYTYQRSELSYCCSFGLTGGTAAGSNGTPSQAGALRYLMAFIDQLTGIVTTSVEYLVADGRAPTVTTDGTLEVFTIATRRLTSLVVASTPLYDAVLDSELAVDQPVTESLMQRMSRNAKFAALSSEVIYLGEFVNGDTVPRPISPADGYEYAYSEVKMLAFWRWTTQGDSFVDPTNGNFKQIRDLVWAIDASTGALTTTVTYYNDGNYVTTNGRVVVMAFCKRAVTLGAGSTLFIDLSVDFLASGRAARADVLGVQAANTRFAICRNEFFEADYTNGQTVALPTSPLDGYAYSREELTYLYSYVNTGSPSSNIRIGSWNCFVDVATGQVTSTIARVQDGGGFVQTTDGHVRVITMARRSHQKTTAGAYQYTAGGNGGQDARNLQNGGFDNWYKNSDAAADSWSVYQQSGAGYSQQAAGLIAGFSQRLGIGASGTANPTPSDAAVTSTPHYVSDLSSSVSISSGVLMYINWTQKPSAGGNTGLAMVMHLYDAIGDEAIFRLYSDTEVLATGVEQVSLWFQIPFKGDSTVACNATAAATTGTVPLVNVSGASTMDFTPTAMRIEFFYDGPVSSYVDLDTVTLINQTDPSVGQVASRGSSSLAYFPALSWTVTDTEFTPNLNITIQRVDGSVTVTSDGTPTITGLTPAAALKWYPYVNERTRHIESIGTGGVGTPPTLQTASTRDLYVQWYAISNLPLALNPIDVVMQATPTGGGSAPPAGGSGGGDDGCLHSSMWVNEKRRGFMTADQVCVGDSLLSMDGVWLKVLATELKPHRDWCELTFSHGGSLKVTAGHPFQTMAGDVVRAWDLALSTMLNWTEGVCSPVTIKHIQEPGFKMKIELEAPHVFFAGATCDRMTLTHNMPGGGVLESTL